MWNFVRRLLDSGPTFTILTIFESYESCLVLTIWRLSAYPRRVEAWDDVDSIIVVCVNAHRRALREGDAKLHEPERSILLALVARSASDTQSWIKTRVEDGDRRAVEFAGLSSELQSHNVVGKGLEQAQAQLLAQAQRLVLGATGVATMPVWLAAVAALVLGIGGFLVHFGSTLGGVLAIFGFAGTVALRANQIFLENVSKEGDALRGPGTTRRESSAVLVPLRSLASVIVVPSMAALVACLVVLALGINHVSGG